MKIMGFSKNGYIIDASNNEVANLLGYLNTFEIGRLKEHDVRMPSIGQEINIEGIYNKIKERERENEALLNIKSSIQKLQEAYDDIEILIDDNKENKGE